MNEYIAKYLKDKINETGITYRNVSKKTGYRVPTLNENIQPERSYFSVRAYCSLQCSRN